jgi:hypothetical protein
MASVLKNMSINNQSDYILKKKKQQCPNKQNNSQVLTMDLSNICCVSKLTPLPQPEPCNPLLPCSPCQNLQTFYMSNDEPFYLTNIIDPIGLLNTTCGKIKYTNYMYYKSLN